MKQEINGRESVLQDAGVLHYTPEDTEGSEMLHQKLAKIFEAEERNDWYEALLLYKQLYNSSHSHEVAIHFAFYCWYMLWQWDEIIFPCEILSFQERIASDTRCGISRLELMTILDQLTKQLLKDADEIPVIFLIVLVHMQRIYPYFFCNETFSDEQSEQLLKELEERPKGNLGAEILLAYQRNSEYRCTLFEEKSAIQKLFPQNSLMEQYFCWLFDCHI